MLLTAALDQFDASQPIEVWESPQLKWQNVNYFLAMIAFSFICIFFEEALDDPLSVLAPYLGWTGLVVFIPMVIRAAWINFQGGPTIRITLTGMQLRDFAEFGEIPWSDVAKASFHIRQGLSARMHKVGSGLPDTLEIEFKSPTKYIRKMGMWNRLTRALDLVVKPIVIPLGLSYAEVSRVVNLINSKIDKGNG